MTQGLCVDDSGKPTGGLPIDPACRQFRPQWSDDIAPWRKHDWPNALGDPTQALAYQASDSVLQRRAGRLLVVQTFDFGTGGRSFGTFDGGFGDDGGDGGQVLAFTRDEASFIMTEDGGSGVQWFVGEGCRTNSDPDAGLRSWLVFGHDIGRPGWASAVARLGTVTHRSGCPQRFNNAFTRYRLDELDFPFRVIEAPPAVTDLRRRLSTIVSEHYGGRNIASADHLERVYMAKGLGLVRWERWANGNRPQPAFVTGAERMLARTDRCPALGRYGAPGAAWQLADCRTWTTLVRQTRSWTVDDFHWRALDELGRRE